MKKSILFAALTALAFGAGAVEVANTPGSLRQLVADRSITELTISGEMDASDFKFIGDSLLNLQSLDLSGVDIVEYNNPESPLITTISHFPAATLPQMMLFNHPLSQIVLPDNLEAIDFGALAGCENLTQITIPATVKHIGDYAFTGSALTEISLPEGLISLGQAAFANCSRLSSANIPAGTIGNQAFEGDALLTTIAIGAGVTAIGNEAFLATGVTTFDASQATALTTIGDFALAQNPLTEIILPNSVNTIGEGTFFGNRALRAVNLPQAVTAVPALAYAEAKSIELDSLLHNNITTIGNYAFFNWTQSTHFYIPSTVTFIGDYAMAGMINLNQIDTDAAQSPELGTNVWAGLDQSIIKLGTPDNEAAATYEAAEQWKEFYILHVYLLGDVNGDGEVNVADLNLMVSRMMGNDPQPFIFLAADINEDQEITVPDLNMLSNYLIEDNAPTVRRVKGSNAAPTTDDRLTLRSFAIAAGEKRQVELMLDNDDMYSALECSISLPEGLNLVGAAATDRSATHIALLGTNANRARLIAYSNSLNDFEGHQGAVLTLTFEATQDIEAGTTIELTDIIFADSNGKWARARNSLTAIDRLTGVDNLTASADNAYAYESTLVIEAEREGTAQIIAVNGTTQQVDLAAGRNSFDHLSAGVYIVRLNGRSFKVAIK